MPHWIKKFVNALETSSSPKSGRDMAYCDSKINLEMIEKVWRNYQSGINLLQTIPKLTKDHFVKNAHSCMRVHLSAQLLSQNVLTMLTDYCDTSDAQCYCDGNLDTLFDCLRKFGVHEKKFQRSSSEHFKEYSSLMLMIERLDTMIDIWNHPYDKTFKRDPDEKRYERINGMYHPYIIYLMNTLAIFADWKEESKRKGNSNLFIPTTLYDSFSWLVYGIMGVALQILEGCSMI